MTEHYTLSQAMDLLGIRSLNSFRQLERKHPDVFRDISPYRSHNRKPWFDKTALDEFARIHKHQKKKL